MRRLRTLVPHQPAGRYECDIAIQYGTGDWPGMVASRIGREALFPVQPVPARGRRQPHDLARQTVIRTTSPLSRAIPRDD